jgi:NAD(P)-dependent dehydrogenase (short-subunit alcohol dehydrogenase family)
VPDRTVFITGCSSGIGRATAVRFGERGYRVIATARKVTDLANLEAQARASNWTLQTTACDVSIEESRQSAVDFAHRTFGPIHILVNNAGYGMMGLVELASLDDARRQLEVNTFGPMHLIQLVAPDMRAAGWGRIVNVSSIVGRIVIPFGGWYSASKFALEALNDAMRLELHPFGIRVISVLPGPVKTEFIQNIVLSTRNDSKPALNRRAEQAYVVFRRRKRPFEISADDVARVIVRAAESKHPRPRYYLTIPAKMGAFGRRFLSDHAVDRVLRAVYGINKLAREGEIS